MKQAGNAIYLRDVIVAPPVGAWIETMLSQQPVTPLIVAPPVGAWIETLVHGRTPNARSCRPPRGGVD